MTPAEVARVLAKASAYDQRTIGETDVAAWHEILGRYDYADALSAVARHYAETRERLMPADLIKQIKAVREERRRLEQQARPERGRRVMTLSPYVDAPEAKWPDHCGYGDTTQAAQGAPGTAQHPVKVRAGHPRAHRQEPQGSGAVRSRDQAAAQGDLTGGVDG